MRSESSNAKVVVADAAMKALCHELHGWVVDGVMEGGSGDQQDIGVKIRPTGDSLA